MTPNFLVSSALALMVAVPVSALAAQRDARPTSAASVWSFNACVVEDNIGPNSPVHDPTFLAPATFPQSPGSDWRCSRATNDSPTWNRTSQPLRAQGPKDSVASRANGVAATRERAASAAAPRSQGEPKPAGTPDSSADAKTSGLVPRRN